MVSYLVLHNRYAHSKMGANVVSSRNVTVSPFQKPIYASRATHRKGNLTFKSSCIWMSPHCFLSNPACNRKSFLLFVASFPAMHESLPQMKPSKRFTKSVPHWSRIQISLDISTLDIYFCIHSFFFVPSLPSVHLCCVSYLATVLLTRQILWYTRKNMTYMKIIKKSNLS